MWVDGKCVIVEGWLPSGVVGFGCGVEFAANRVKLAIE